MASDPEREKAPETPALEWAVATLGLLMVLSAAAFMLYNASTDRGRPPVILLTVDTVLPGAHGYVVRFRARNQGGATAAALQVEGELRSDTGTVETASATLSYVPPRAERLGGLIFEADPRSFDLKLRAKGFDLP